MAQLIPLVFIALMIEMRVLDTSVSSSFDSALEAVGLIVLILAECVALGAIYTGRDNDLIFILVAGGTFFGATTILWAVMLPILEAWARLPRSVGRVTIPFGLFRPVPFYVLLIGLIALVALLFK